MRANEFVKKFGWLLSKAFAENWSDLAIHYGFDINDLKRLVDSHDLVEKLGGLENAKDEYFSCVQNREAASYVAKAITDVESCQ